MESSRSGKTTWVQALVGSNPTHSAGLSPGMLLPPQGGVGRKAITESGRYTAQQCAPLAVY